MRKEQESNRVGFADSECPLYNVPLVEDIDRYFEREVKPYNAEAWIDKSKTKVGYEIPFTRYFYKYEAPESSEEIEKRLSVLEADIMASLTKLFGEA